MSSPACCCDYWEHSGVQFFLCFLWTSILLQTDGTLNPLAKEELNLLARLMGSMKAENRPKAETGFRINLFTTDQEEEEA